MREWLQWHYAHPRVGFVLRDMQIWSRIGYAPPFWPVCMNDVFPGVPCRYTEQAGAND